MHGKLVIVHFNRAILRWTVRTCGFECVMIFPQEKVLKSNGTCKFTALVRADATTIVVAMMPKKFRDDVQRRFLGGSEEDPNIS